MRYAALLALLLAIPAHAAFDEDSFDTGSFDEAAFDFGGAAEFPVLGLGLGKYVYGFGYRY